MNCGKNVRLKPKKIRIAAARAQYSGYMPAGDLRPPVMQPAEIGRHHAADHDVVEMRDDEIGVGDIDVVGEAGEEQPGQAADGEQADESQRIEHRRIEMIQPLCSVAVQLNTLIADGTATMKLMNENTRPANSDCPLTNMWWPQTKKPIAGDRDAAPGDELVAEHGLREKHGMSSLTTPMPGRIMM